MPQDSVGGKVYSIIILLYPQQWLFLSSIVDGYIIIIICIVSIQILHSMSNWTDINFKYIIYTNYKFLGIISAKTDSLSLQCKSVIAAL